MENKKRKNEQTRGAKPRARFMGHHSGQNEKSRLRSKEETKL